MDEIATRISAARRNRGWGGAEGGGGGGGADALDWEWGPLLLLARMFAQEQAAIEDLGDMWKRDPKWTEFFLPQVSCACRAAHDPPPPGCRSLLVSLLHSRHPPENYLVL